MTTNAVRAVTGLCRTCDHRQECSHAAIIRSPIWSCEEFEARGDPSESADDMVVGIDTMGREAAAPSLGLCVTCENREHCHLSSTEGGIWHCEEYQ